MTSNEYHFVTKWRVPGTVREVYDVLGDGPDLVRWWPSVYLDVKQIEEGDERGVGRVISLYTKGWLPYTLSWNGHITDVRDDGFTLEAHGDFEGRGDWTFEQAGPWVDVTYDWRVRADKPLLRLFSPIMKPLFEANHVWAMRMGEESLNLELARRQARSPEERARIPAPPPATFTDSRPLLAGGLIVLVLGLVLLFGMRRR